MALRLYGNKRDANEGDIIKALEKAGCDVIQTNTPTDLIVGRAGVTYLIECKTRNGKLTPDQVTFHREWRGHKAIVYNEVQALRAVGL